MKYHWTIFDKIIHRLMRLQCTNFLDTGILDQLLESAKATVKHKYFIAQNDSYNSNY